jgi:hypothetical protein
MTDGEAMSLTGISQTDRGILVHELEDPDFSWLLNSYQELHPEYSLVSRLGVPVVLIGVPMQKVRVPLLPAPPVDDSDL